MFNYQNPAWLVLAICLEEFVALMRKEGKVTVPKALRDRFKVSDGCYIHLALIEVHRRGENGVWVKQTLEH
jgi:bifunctional DNA-binding transcriptional regulator/antitoxin component of YhaV-PrlF toxin-antitoxin module